MAVAAACAASVRASAGARPGRQRHEGEHVALVGPRAEQRGHPACRQVAARVAPGQRGGALLGVPARPGAGRLGGERDGEREHPGAVGRERQALGPGRGLPRGDLPGGELGEEPAALAQGQELLLVGAQRRERDDAGRALDGDPVEVVDGGVERERHEPARPTCVAGRDVDREGAVAAAQGLPGREDVGVLGAVARVEEQLARGRPRGPPGRRSCRPGRARRCRRPRPRASAS
jgi:hypothetical protein